MRKDLFSDIANAEYELANFYEEISNQTRFKNYPELFEYLINSSREHGKKIVELEGKFQPPYLNFEQFLHDIQHQILMTLKNDIINSENIQNSINIMSRTEELLGKTYVYLSNYFKSKAQFYYNLSTEMEVIGQEEYTHRDMIITKLEEIKNKPKT